jgi:SAM-dependent methyltransferase
MILRILKWLVRSVRDQLRTTPSQRLRRAKAWQRFWKSYIRYSQLRVQENENNTLHLWPIVGEDEGITEIEPIYFYQDAWAFEKIVKARPDSHVDVASHHKFVALLSKVLPVTMIDIRPLQLPLPSLGFQKGNILEMPYEDGTVKSISSLCVVEHIGLGRYGDSLDVRGTEKAITELKRVLAPGGDLYVSIPINVENATFFNAHRVFDEKYLRTLFEPLEVIDCHYIYGNEFTENWQNGMGVGCYHLRAPKI